MVYVDEIVDYGRDYNAVTRRHGGRWCHMTADTRQELDAMARRIGLNTAWIQHEGRPSEHYDLIPSKRALAVGCGAQEIDYLQAGAKMATKAERMRAEREAAV